ncbi:hypothetical protein D3C76_986930 [compost metagenome]
MRQRLGEGAVGHQGIEAAREQQPGLQRAQLAQLQGVGPGCQQRGAAEVDHHHHLGRTPVAQQLLLRQAVEGPDEGRQQDDQHSQGVLAHGGEQLFQALVEEQAEAQHRHRQAEGLPQAEALLEDVQAAQQEKNGRHLDHQLRGAGAEHVQAHQVEHIVASEPSHRQRQQPAAARAQRTQGRQAAVGAQVEEQQRAGHHQPVPGDGHRVHGLQHFFQPDGQHPPEHGRDQGEEQAVEPTAGGDMHGGCLCGEHQATARRAKNAILGVERRWAQEQFGACRACNCTSRINSRLSSPGARLAALIRLK